MFLLVLLLVLHSPSLTAGGPPAGWRNDIRSFYFLSVCLVTHLHRLVKPLILYIAEYSLPIFHSASYFVQRSTYLEYSHPIFHSASYFARRSTYLEYSHPIFHSASYFVQRSKYLEYSQHETYDEALTPTQRAAERAAER